MNKQTLAVGLDRIPEVKTLRNRIACFTQQGDVAAWSKKLSQAWLAANENLAGVLYIDGHVNIYDGYIEKYYYKSNQIGYFALNCIP